MLITMLVMTYIIVSLFCTLVIFGPHLVASRVETAEERALDESDLKYHFDHTRWSGKASR
jgi:hypothetical protein